MLTTIGKVGEMIRREGWKGVWAGARQGKARNKYEVKLGQPDFFLLILIQNFGFRPN